MRPVVVLEINVSRLVQELQIRVRGGRKIKRTVHAGRYLDIEGVALLESHSPIDKRLVRSDRDSQRICVRLKGCQQAQKK